MNVSAGDVFDRRVGLKQAGAGVGMLGALQAFAESPEGLSGEFKENRRHAGLAFRLEPSELFICL